MCVFLTRSSYSDYPITNPPNGDTPSVEAEQQHSVVNNQPSVAVFLGLASWSGCVVPVEQSQTR